MTGVCTIKWCTAAAEVVYTIDRPSTTSTRDRDFSCWTGHHETPYCAIHACERVSLAPDRSWAFWGDVVTLRPVAL